ncbi:hypothetical protein CAPTEDRAFT_217058 [Capitella teleta]|uniref:Uncharacterized protein n=1 Tax=Capitella teleta TaxID=283909 RepID=R7V631_CAPTE|nr:hypothetical protein CAPTEDRAFT_217058 [Capitella teleta]|eukprot:ELU14323.1 hypothetical protein CAPTEDRAFT_217058 [Capitella teleta]
MGERKAVLLLIAACVATAGSYSLRKSQDERACASIGTELVTFVDFIANANPNFDLRNKIRIMAGIDVNTDVDDIQDILCTFAELSTNDFVGYLRQSGVEYNLVRGAYVFIASATLNTVRETFDMPFSTTIYNAGFTMIDPEAVKEFDAASSIGEIQSVLDRHGIMEDAVDFHKELLRNLFSRMPSLESDANEEWRSQYQRDYVRHIIRLLRAFESAGFFE